MKRKGGGKHKGSAFERTICKKLSEWQGADEVIYWRSASSGARSTQLAKSGIKATLTGGDITALSEEGSWLTGYFSVECKFYADFSFELLLQNKGKLPEWWKQCRLDSNRDGKHPMMIVKKNRSPIYIAFDPTTLTAISHYIDYSKTVQFVYHSGESEKSMIIMLFEDWMEITDHESLKEFIINAR